MKQKHLLSLLQQGMTTVQVEFLQGRPGGAPAPLQPMPAQPPRNDVPWSQHTSRTPQPWDTPTPPAKVYTYKAPIGLLADGDIVVVQDDKSPYGLALGRVHHVDSVARIDVDADFDYKWVVSKVDTTAYAKRVQEERAFADTMQAVEATRQREQLVRTMTEHLPQGTEARAQFDAALAQFAAPSIAAPASDAQDLEAGELARQGGFVGGMQCK
jgi:hypothetical protein